MLNLKSECFSRALYLKTAVQHVGVSLLFYAKCPGKWICTDTLKDADSFGGRNTTNSFVWFNFKFKQIII